MSKPTETISSNDVSEPRWFAPLARWRFLLAGIYLLSALGLFAWLVFVYRWNADRGVIDIAIIGIGLFAGQAMLLAGAPQLHAPKKPRPRHIAISLFVGALTAAALSFGFLATVVSLLGHKMDWIGRPEWIAPSFDWPWLLFVLIGLPWLFWLIVFSLLWARRWSKGFGRMYRLLVAGTFVELLFTVPVDVFVRRRTQCWCDEGTFFALAAGITTAFWTFGPGVVLLFLAVRIRRRRRTGHCLRCGYDLRGLPEPRCPECGTAFER